VEVVPTRCLHHNLNESYGRERSDSSSQPRTALAQPPTASGKNKCWSRASDGAGASETTDGGSSRSRGGADDACEDTDRQDVDTLTYLRLN